MATETSAEIIQLFQSGEIVSAIFTYSSGLSAGSLLWKFHSNDNAGGDHKYIHLGSTAGIAHPVQGVFNTEDLRTAGKQCISHIQKNMQVFRCCLHG